MKLLFPLFVAAFVAAGCASTQVTTVNLSDPRPSIPASAVKLGSPPAGAVCLADIFAISPMSDRGTKAAQDLLKTKAASIGANYLEITRYNTSSMLYGESDRFQIEGRAYCAQ